MILEEKDLFNRLEVSLLVSDERDLFGKLDIQEIKKTIATEDDPETYNEKWKLYDTYLKSWLWRKVIRPRILARDDKLVRHLIGDLKTAKDEIEELRAVCKWLAFYTNWADVIGNEELWSSEEELTAIMVRSVASELKRHEST